MKKVLISMGLCLAGSVSTSLMATEACPAAPHTWEVCGTLTVTDYMGVPGTTTKFWIKTEDAMIRLGKFAGNWGGLAAAAFMHQHACLYSDQESIEGTIDIAEICR